MIFKHFAHGMQLARFLGAEIRPTASSHRMNHEVIALLFPETARAKDGGVQMVMALLRDATGLMELHNLRPDVALIKRARVTGRVNCGKPIVDPVTREVMGYEIEPIVLPAA
jgi:hypothetical protein